MGLEKFVQLSNRVTQRMQGCIEHQQSQSAVPLISPPTRVCRCSRTRCGLHESWDHPSTVGHRWRLEVGWEMFLFMLPFTTYLSISASQTLTCPVNLDWKSPRITICGFSCWFCPLQWHILPKMSLPTTTSQAMELHHRPHTSWASAAWQDISSLHPWTEGHVGVYTEVTSTGLHPFFYLLCCFKLFFFMAKKDWGLRPCIDYRALNQISLGTS